MYYHFLRADGCLRYGPLIKVEVGQTLTCEGKLELCKNGLHASGRVIDALKYAPGPILCGVHLGGKILRGTDKVCAENRTVVSIDDISSILQEFACQVGSNSLKKHNVTDKVIWDAIFARRKWLRGESTQLAMQLANDLAWDRAWGVLPSTYTRAKTTVMQAVAGEMTIGQTVQSVWLTVLETANADGYAAITDSSAGAGNLSDLQWKLIFSDAFEASISDSNELLMELLCTTTS